MDFKKFDDYIKSIYGEGTEATACIHFGSKIIISYILMDVVGVKEVTVTDEEWEIFELTQTQKNKDHD